MSYTILPFWSTKNISFINTEIELWEFAHFINFWYNSYHTDYPIWKETGSIFREPTDIFFTRIDCDALLFDPSVYRSDDRPLDWLPWPLTNPCDGERLIVDVLLLGGLPWLARWLWIVLFINRFSKFSLRTLSISLSIELNEPSVTLKLFRRCVWRSWCSGSSLKYCISAVLLGRFIFSLINFKKLSIKYLRSDRNKRGTKANHQFYKQFKVFANIRYLRMPCFWVFRPGKL